MYRVEELVGRGKQPDVAFVCLQGRHLRAQCNN
jgi:hypothetical protein